MGETRTATHRFLALAIVPLILVGCASTSVPQSTETPPSTAATVAPTTEATDLETPDEEPSFGPGSLAQLCIEATSSDFDADVAFAPDVARIEERKVEPLWLVLVPAESNGFEGQAQCTIGGDPSDPIIDMAVASIHQLPEQQIQNLINGVNEGGTD